MIKRILFLTVVSSLVFTLTTVAGAFKLPDTGETKCYQGVATYAETPCAGAGQDGAYTINPMSFTDNGNGTVTDNNTGLIWQKYENASTYNWYQASGTYDANYNPSSQSVCGSLNLGGYSDWRLPTKKELMSIVDYSIPDPGPTINTTYFPNTYADYYWSSTTCWNYSDRAWHVCFDYGYVVYADNMNYMHVRCTRGGQYPEQNFVDNNDGTVTDNATGLMWQQGEPGPMTWDAALSYCEGLPLGGHSDWRLPNIKELESITDDSSLNPAIDMTFFPNATTYQYWSSTTYTYNPYYAWYVHFYNGYVFPYGKDDGNYMHVRCARGGQSGSLGNCEHSLTININPSNSGSVTKNPDKNNYCDNEQVTLTANPGAGFDFSSWGGVDSSNGLTAYITMSNNRTVDVSFTQQALNEADLNGNWLFLTQTCKNTKKGIKCNIKGNLDIQNIGSKDAKTSVMKYYLSDDNNYDGGDIFLKKIATGKIKAGRSVKKTFAYNFKTGFSATGKYIIAALDVDNKVIEADEGNNDIIYGPLP